VLRALDYDPIFFGYWDADLATPLNVILEFRDVLECRPSLEAILGSRVRLLGREVRRSPGRHYLGRVFASASSLVLGLSVYDTQCGAKLFRSSPTTRSLFQTPFASSWIFDVEILARFMAARGRGFQPRADRALFEFPLHRWRDVHGSKVKPIAFLRAPLELLAIYFRYRTGVRADGPTIPAHTRPHFPMSPIKPQSSRGKVEGKK
jgi:hypothetical protein